MALACTVIPPTFCTCERFLRAWALFSSLADTGTFCLYVTIIIQLTRFTRFILQQINCTISYFFSIFKLYACITKFNVIKNFQKFLNFRYN
jgi:hypothetical protein